MDYMGAQLAVFVILLLVSLYRTRMDIIAPTVLFNASFFLCFVLLFFFRDTWEAQWSLRSFYTVSGGAVLFTTTGLTGRRIARKLRAQRAEQGAPVNVGPEEIHRPILLRDAVFYAVIALSIVGVVWTYFVIVKNAKGYDAIIYRDMRVADRISGDFVLAQIQKFVFAASMMIGYVMLYNLNFSGVPLKSRKNLLFLLMVVFVAVFSSLFTGGRQIGIEMLLGIFFIYYMLYRQKHTGTKANWRIVLGVAAAFVLAVPLFYWLAPMIGRHVGSMNLKSAMEYFVRYFSGGAYAFDGMIDTPAVSTYWGEQSFSDVYVFLQKLGLLHGDFTSYREFTRYGNTVTLYGRWYEDFGLSGVLIMNVLVAAAFSYLYDWHIQFARSPEKQGLAIILYAKFGMALVWAGYDDRVRAIFSFETAATVIFMVLCYLCVFRWKGTQERLLEQHGKD